MKRGKKYVVEKFPEQGGCEFCPEVTRRGRGCGVTAGIPWTETATGDGYAGMSASAYNEASIKHQVVRHTCPQYFLMSPFVLSILDDLDDYESGRMQVIDDMDDAHLFYMRVASAERKAWEATQQQRLTET